MRRLLRLLRRQDGISLVMAVGVLSVLSVSGTALVYYSQSNSQSAEYSKDKESAYSVAEAGINEMMAVLSNPKNNALNEYLLGKQPDGSIRTTVNAYPDGTVEWWGTLDKSTATWSLTSIGRLRNPVGPSMSDVERKLTAKVPVTPSVAQELNNPSWNYIMSTATGNPCDMTIGSTVEVRTNLYVFGNLCLKESAKILKGETHPTKLVVNGRLDQATNQNTAGTSTAKVKEIRIGNGCEWFTKPLYNPCITGSETSVYAEDFFTTKANLVAPVGDFKSWYLNAAPGPYYPCTTKTGSPPVFDDPVAAASAPDATKLTYKNNNLAVVNLTPTGANASYSCKVAGGGELTWDAANKVLTVNGTIYIDGDLKVEFAAPTTVQYNGQATIYASGSLKMKNVKLCGGIVGANCDFSAWDPNKEMLVFAADGDNRQTEVDTGYSISLLNTHFQGALYATKKMDIDSFSKVDGPMVGTEVVLGQSVSTNDFPTITSVPAGMPGEETIYAQPNSPELYSG